MLNFVTSAFKVHAASCRREVPREPLLLVIRSFGGAVAWAGQGSPLDEADESITHQVCHWIQLGNPCPTEERRSPTGTIDDLQVSTTIPEQAAWCPGSDVLGTRMPRCRMQH
jgi:hypothetical protein